MLHAIRSDKPYRVSAVGEAVSDFGERQGECAPPSTRDDATSTNKSLQARYVNGQLQDIRQKGLDVDRVGGEEADDEAVVRDTIRVKRGDYALQQRPLV